MIKSVGRVDRPVLLNPWYASYPRRGNIHPIESKNEWYVGTAPLTGICYTAYW